MACGRGANLPCAKLKGTWFRFIRAAAENPELLKFPNLRKKEDWNHVQISFKGPRLQVTLNGTKICDMTDKPADPAEAAWKEAGPISFQWPHGGEAEGFAGFVKLRNVRIRDL